MMFVVNLAGYSQRLFEDETEIRMHEALRLFEKVVGNPAFKQSHIVVRFWFLLLSLLLLLLLIFISIFIFTIYSFIGSVGFE